MSEDKCLRGTFIVTPIEYATGEVQCQVCGTKCKEIYGEIAEGLANLLFEKENKRYRVYYHN